MFSSTAICFCAKTTSYTTKQNVAWPTFSTTIARCTPRKIHISAPEKGQKLDSSKEWRLYNSSMKKLPFIGANPVSIRHFKFWRHVVCGRFVRLKSCNKLQEERLGTCRFQIPSRLGVSKIKSKMARVEQQCATEGNTDSPYLQLSYFTIYLTKGIEILEYYTKVSYWLYFIFKLLVIVILQWR